MANVKITELTALTNPASSDVLPIVDIGADETKKVTIADLLENAGSGTAAAPGIAFDGDSNTGIYRPGADQLALATNGTGRLFIDGSGNVGVGTSSPQDKLQIQDGRISIASVATENSDTVLGTLMFRNGSNNNRNAKINAYQEGGTSGAGLRFYTRTHGDGTNNDGGIERMRIDSSGNVGIGTTSVDSELHISKADVTPKITLQRTGSATSKYSIGAGGGALTFYDEADAREAFRVDTDGRLLVGTSSSSQIGSTNSAIQVRGTGPDNAGLSISRFSDNGASGYLSIGKARGSIATPVIVDDDDIIGTIQFAAYDGGDLATSAAEITAEVDGTPGANDMPGRLVFSTTADGASSPTERMRIDSLGNVGIGTMPNVKLEIGLPTGVSQVNSNVLRINRGVTGQYAEFSAASGAAFINGVNGNGGGIRFLGDGNERARIDTSGRLLVGTSSWSGTNLVTIQGNTSTASGGGELFLARGASAGTILDDDLISRISFGDQDDNDYAKIECQADGTTASGDYPGRLVFSTTADGASTPTERMRITNTGGIKFNTTSDTIDSSNFGTIIGSNSVGNADAGLFRTARNQSGVQVVLQAYGNAGQFRTMGDGDVENTNNSYGGLSDARLKENIVDANSQWNDLKALQVRNYNFKPDTGYSTHTQIGLIAQEVELVSPGLVGESIDEETGESTKSVNYSVLYMKAVKALQEAMERIETLEASNTDLLARVTALEAS